MRNAIRHLAAADPAMAALIQRIGRCGYRQERREPYEALVRAIAHQQLHGAAARTILGRFMALHPDVPFPSPRHVLSTDQEAMRGCGLSRNKIAAIRDIALKASEGVVPTRRMAMRLSNEELIARLTVIRGVGRWTVEMMLMFNLARMDILPVDDFGVREGYRRLHGLETQPKPRELAAIGEMWSPWRSVASWYLWRAAEERPPARPAATLVA